MNVKYISKNEGISLDSPNQAVFIVGDMLR